MFRDGLARYEAGAPDEAASLFAAHAERFPHHADAHRLKGLALVRSGHAREALPALALARKLAPHDPLSHLHYGIGLLEAGHPARAAARLRRATMMRPDDFASWVHFSAAILAIGQPPAARAAARRAIRIAPDRGEGFCALGRAERAAGNLAAARSALIEATKRAPTLAEAWVDLGVTCLQIGNIGEAMESMERALVANPGHTVAEATLASLMIMQGEYAGGKERLRALVERAPACVAARLNLANAMLLDREAKQALALLSPAPPAGREGAHWRAHRALALLILRRDSEARTELDAIPQPYGDVEILIAWRQLVLAERSGDPESAERLADRIHQLADTPGSALLEHRILGHFDLATYRSRRDNSEDAMMHWTAAHKLLSQVQPFSRKAVSDFVDASIESYDAVRLRDGPRAAIVDQAPVFIVGLPRSGTTLAEQILSSHPDIFGASERSALHRTAAKLAGPTDKAATVRSLAAIGPEVLTQTASTYLEELHAEGSGQRFIVDKMPGNALLLGFLATLLPGARIIHCRRDLRDIGLSIFQLRFFGHHPYAHDLADLGWYMSQHQRLTAHWHAVLPIPIMDVELSDWAEDFKGTLSRVLTFLDLPYDPACERFHEQRRLVRTASAAQVRQPVNRRGIGRWKEYQDYLAPMLAELEAPPA